jgi:transposase
VTPLRASVTKEEQWAFIKCHVLLGTTAYEITKMLPKIAESNAHKERQIYNIYRQFKEEERLTCDDEPRLGRPCTATDQEHEKNLEKLLEEQKSWTAEELAFRL